MSLVFLDLVRFFSIHLNLVGWNAIKIINKWKLAVLYKWNVSCFLFLFWYWLTKHFFSSFSSYLTKFSSTKYCFSLSFSGPSVTASTFFMTLLLLLFTPKFVQKINVIESRHKFGLSHEAYLQALNLNFILYNFLVLRSSLLYTY